MPVNKIAQFGPRVLELLGPLYGGYADGAGWAFLLFYRSLMFDVLALLLFPSLKFRSHVTNDK